MTSKQKWIAIAIAAALCAAVAVRTLSSRSAQQESLTAQQEAQKIQAVIELSDRDVVKAGIRELSLGLPVSGPLKAVRSALVKARVPGDLQDLSVREGEFVAQGQVIARVEPTEYQSRLRQAQQQAEAAKAQVDIAKRSYDNSSSLVAQGFISKTALDTSTATLASAEATLRGAQAAVELGEKSLQDTVMRAPIAGLISQRLAQPGERVSIDARIVEIVDLQQIELEASLSAADSMRVKVGQTAQLSIEGTDLNVNARVVRINPSAVAGSRSVLVYLAVNTVPGLRQGLFAQGLLATGSEHTMAVPLSAVRTDAPQPYVQLVQDGKVVHQTVVMGARGVQNDETYVAVQGINADTTLLAGTVGTVRAGTLVKHTALAK